MSLAVPHKKNIDMAGRCTIIYLGVTGILPMRFMSSHGYHLCQEENWPHSLASMERQEALSLELDDLRSD